MYFTKSISTILLILVIATGWFVLSGVSSFDGSLANHTTHSEPKLIPQDERNYQPLTFFRSNKISKKTNTLDYKPFLSLQADPIIGDTRLFWVYNIRLSTPTNPVYDEINATLRAKGQHNLIYTNLTNSQFSFSVLDAINQSFEESIYPSLTEFFGNPPDKDSDNKTIILFLDIDDGLTLPNYVAGFFDPTHQSDTTYSEKAEILHIDGIEGKPYLSGGDYDVIAHEFQHLIHYGNDNDEQVWLEEGASMFAEYLIGEDPFLPGSSYKVDLVNNPDVSLTYWDQPNSPFIFANYGASYAFFLYLAEHYGGSSIIQDIVNETYNGITSIEQALSSQGYSGDFKEIFRNWTIANFICDTSFADGAYGYYNTTLNMNLDVPPYTQAPLPRTTNSVPYWGTDYLEFDYPSESPFVLEFQGDGSAGFLVSAILTNTSTPPLNTEVVSIPISGSGFGNFSTKALGYSADSIVIVVSAYTKPPTPSFDNYDPAPSQTYWYMVNPEGLIVSPGDLEIIMNGKLLLDLWNILVTDKKGFVWSEADGAVYDILTDLGESSGIMGNLIYNSANNYWEATSINISGLPEGDYYVQFYFYNSSSSGFAYSETFSISSETTSTTPTTKDNLPISGLLVVLAILSLIILFSKGKKKE
ncbi:MAG: hypothetical protein ACFE9L_02530 [Candidatus Hodarchaeota archaeon]